jgi:membrane protein required for colicin V production
MDGFTIIDAVVAVVILLSAILAYSRGFVREGLSIAGWIAAAVLAYMFAAPARPLIAQIPVIDGFLSDSCELATIGGFAAVFALALIVFSILTPLFASVVQRSALGGIDQGLGFLFGVARGVVLVAVAFVVFDRVVVDRTFPVVDDSRASQMFASVQGNLDSQLPSDAPGWLVQRFEQLVASCPAPAN